MPFLSGTKPCRGEVLLGEEKQNAGFAGWDRNKKSNQPKLLLPYSSKHLCLIPYFSFEGCSHVALVMGKPCCCTSCRPAGKSLVLLFPTLLFTFASPFPRRGTGSAGHLPARNFTSLTESSTSLLRTGSVFQAGGDTRSACLRLSSDSSVCNW